MIAAYAATRHALLYAGSAPSCRYVQRVARGRITRRWRRRAGWLFYGPSGRQNVTLSVVSIDVAARCCWWRRGMELLVCSDIDGNSAYTGEKGVYSSNVRDGQWGRRRLVTKMTLWRYLRILVTWW